MHISNSARPRTTTTLLVAGVAAATLLGGCGGGDGGGAATGSGDSIALGAGVPAAPPARRSLNETTWSGIEPTDPAAMAAYEYVAEFNELMVLPSAGRLEQRQSASCTQCTALTDLVQQQIDKGTHYEKPVWIIRAVSAQPAGADGRRDLSISLDPVKEPVLAADGSQVTLGDDWKRTVQLGLAPVPGSDGQFEVDKVAIANG